MKKKLHGLYAITDEKLMSVDDFSSMAETALNSGVSVLQYRDKSHNTEKRLAQALQLKKMCDQNNITFIINDDVDLAVAVDADGVHIGINDSSYASARELLGKNKIIGVTCYNQFETALQAERLGADYIAFGSFFASSVKPDAVVASRDLLLRAKQELSIPVCAIGGITLYNSAELINAGADMLAIITGVFGADDIQLACESFNELFYQG